MSEVRAAFGNNIRQYDKEIGILETKIEGVHYGLAKHGGFNKFGWDTGNILRHWIQAKNRLT